MTHPSISLAEQIAAVERALHRAEDNPYLPDEDEQRLAAALATLRGLLPEGNPTAISGRASGDNSVWD